MAAVTLLEYSLSCWKLDSSTSTKLSASEENVCSILAVVAKETSVNDETGLDELIPGLVLASRLIISSEINVCMAWILDLVKDAREFNATQNLSGLQYVDNERSAIIPCSSPRGYAAGEGNAVSETDGIADADSDGNALGNPDGVGKVDADAVTDGEVDGVMDGVLDGDGVGSIESVACGELPTTNDAVQK